MVYKNVMQSSDSIGIIHSRETDTTWILLCPKIMQKFDTWSPFY